MLRSFIFVLIFPALFVHSFVGITNSAFLRVTRRYGLFDVFKKAFENDDEYAIKDDPGTTTKRVEDTKFFSRKVRPESLVNTTWNLRLGLSGIPRNDPSNDLYAPKKIEGIEISLEVMLLKDGIVFVKENDLTVPDAAGKWLLEGDSLAVSVLCDGFERLVKTKGSLLNVYGGEDTSRTTSSYFFPKGTCLIQCTILQNETGRLIIRDGGKVLGKDPRNKPSKFSPGIQEWTRTGSLIQAVNVIV